VSRRNQGLVRGSGAAGPRGIAAAAEGAGYALFTPPALRKGGKGIARSRRHSIARHKNTRLETVPPARSTPTFHQPSATPSQRSAMGEAPLRNARADRPRPRRRRLYQPVSNPGAKSLLGLEIGDEDLLKCGQPVPFSATPSQRSAVGEARSETPEPIAHAVADRPGCPVSSGKGEK